MSNSVRDKTRPVRPNFRRARPSYLSNLSSASSASAPRLRLAAAPSGAPSCASAPPVKGLLRIAPGTRKHFLRRNPIFLDFLLCAPPPASVRAVSSELPLPFRTLCAQKAAAIQLYVHIFGRLTRPPCHADSVATPPAPVRLVKRAGSRRPRPFLLVLFPHGPPWLSPGRDRHRR